jgi:hypothetical protein
VEGSVALAKVTKPNPAKPVKSNGSTCDQCGTKLKIGDFPYCGGDASKHGKQYGGWKFA